MKTYLVGGAVRDTLLGLEPKDKDYVVVGSSVEEMLSLGFSQVGKDFPVFLHPETGDEHALARKEISVGASHTDFECDVKDVTLEEDLMRRDLTINSMAMDEDGNIIDPFGGQRDIENRVFRATSDAFSEDPLRVLRMARLYARFGHEWSVEEKTVNKALRLLWSGQVKAISGERIWKETERALMEQCPQIFLDFLCYTYAIHVPSDDRDNLKQALQRAVRSGLPAEDRWGIFCTFLGGEELLKLDELKTPRVFRETSWRVRIRLEDFSKMTAEEVLNSLNNINAFRDPSSLPRLLGIAACIHPSWVMHGVFWQWMNCLNLCKNVGAQPFVERGFTGKTIGEMIRNEQIRCIEEVKQDG